MPKTSIVIPTHNHCSDLLTPCIDKILQHTSLDDVEIIVVANGCTDGTRGYLTDKPVKLIWFDEGLGYTKATNAGIRAATGDIIILMNNDAFLLDFQAKNVWLDRLLEPFSDPAVGITAPLKIYDETVEREFAVFFLVAIRRDMFDDDKAGMLDEAFCPGGYEDVDFCIKVENLGYKVVMVANKSGVDHEKGLVITDYPVYHKGEGTVLDAQHSEEWYKVIEKNKKFIGNRWRLPEGAFTPGDIAEYRRLANEVPVGGTICEYGSWRGRSLCSIADIIKRKSLKVIVVDTFEGSTNEAFEREVARQNDIFTIFSNNVERFGLKPIIQRMTGDEAAELVAKESLNLCFIDANHTYESLKTDLEKWEPKLRLGGVIGGHDYSGVAFPNPSWPGVKKAVDERYRDIHYDGYSLVWSKRIDIR